MQLPNYRIATKYVYKYYFNNILTINEYKNISTSLG